MFGSEILDVAIGMAFLFAALSLFATGFREVLEGLLQTRAIHLERGIRSLLNDNEKLTEMLYSHPLVSSLYTGDYPAAALKGRWFKRKDQKKRAPYRSNLPAYIPARNFASALLDLAGRGEPGVAPESALTLANVRERLDTLIPDAKVRRALSIAIDDAAGDMERARLNVQKWFDSGMDRVSGWYRKETQWILFGIGLVAAVTLNVDTIKVATTLYNNEALRTAVVKQAEAAAEVVAKTEGDPTPAILKSWGCEAATGAKLQDCTEARIAKLGLPVGWDQKSPFSPSSIPGWLLTGLAISLGAPFWFDLLNKMMVIRSTVKPHEKSPEESSEDRQTKIEREPPRAPSPPPPPPPPTQPVALPPTESPPGEPNRIEADDLPDAEARLGGKLDPMEDGE